MQTSMSYKGREYSLDIPVSSEIGIVRPRMRLYSTILLKWRLTEVNSPYKSSTSNVQSS